MRSVCGLAWLGTAAIVVTASCSGDGAASNGSPDGGPLSSADGGSLDGATNGDGSGGGSDGPTTAASKARALTEKLGGTHAGHFLIGVGADGTNDGNDDAYALGVPLDLHYHYLTNVHSSGGWVTWNSNPDYVGKRIRESRKHGVVTMLTLYMMASWGDGNVQAELESATFMADWFADYAQMLASVKAEGDVALLHIEPDFWGYNQQRLVTKGGAPSSIKVMVSASQAPECAAMPDTLVGFAQCILAMARARTPKLLVGYHASVWGTNFDTGGNTDPKLDVVAEANKSVAYFKTLGADQADFVVTDVSDRDAGCYEAGHAPMCSPARPNAYWDETNQKLPHFKQHFAWAKALSDGLALPLVWWQLPYGSPAATPGAVGAWRDNRVHYFFSHVGELVAAGGVAAAWGDGAGDQTYLTQEFRTAISGYYGAPFSLP